MKKTIALIASVLTLGINSTTFAQSDLSKSGKSLLWKISGKKLNKPSYLFGTIHIICLEDFIWTNKMIESLDKSEKICFEMDLDNPELMQQTMELMKDKSGKKIRDYFKPEQYTIISKYVQEKMGVDLSMLNGMKPIMLESLLIKDQAHCPNAIGYEDTIMKIGKKTNKEIMGLEEPKEQIEALESIPVDSFINSLMEEISTQNGNDTNYAKLMNAYKTQDLPTLFRLINESKELGDNMAPFLDDRNTKWISKMTDKMSKSSVFFAVGAGHLWGDKGVITLLRKEGYTVEAIK